MPLRLVEEKHTLSHDLKLASCISFNFSTFLFSVLFIQCSKEKKKNTKIISFAFEVI